MLFNSLNFAIFLPVVFILYWFIFNKSLKVQNILLLLCSYFFYSCWDWRFLFLLVFSTFLDYFTGLRIYNSESKRTRKIWLCISVFINIGFLGFFKYYNFFLDSFTDLFQNWGYHGKWDTLKIILPIGISFYTFHGLSYVFDIYNRKIRPSTNFVEYSLFVSFFPLLVAGPIERATHLLPQVEKKRVFNYSTAVNGLKQITWGLFKKLVIADNCAQLSNTIFNNYSHYSGSTLALGAILFAFQIYGDFSGYSDIAIGTAKLFGFDLLKNFAYPYFSRDMAEFWRRWHISLSSWFKDYLYFPLGGSRGSMLKTIRNTFIIFLVSGFWHGANWTFIIWGGLNALFIIPLVIFKRNRNNLEIVAQGKRLPTFKEALHIILTFALTVFAWIFFRAATVHDALRIILRIFSASLFHKLQVIPKLLFFLLPVFILIEWIGREDSFPVERIGINWPRFARWSFYSFLIFCICMFMYTDETSFIYFQF